MSLVCSVCLSLLGVTLAAPPPAAPARACRGARTALVLSGGGAPGLAHVGVIRVLDSLGVRPDYVIGSSMGAVVGAMYASGYTGRELDSLVRALPLHDLFGARSPLPWPLAEWPYQLALRHGNGRVRLESPFVRERELNVLLSAWMLRGNLQAAGDFDSLSIPFRAVATDLEHRRPVVLARGDLAQAVRASIAVPLVLRPLRVEGHWLGDGSLTANIPVAIARELGAERIIVSDVTRRLADTLDLDGWGNMGQLVLSMLLSQEWDSLGTDDVVVRSDVGGMAKFDFSPRARNTLIARGYAAATEVLAGAPCLAAGFAPARPHEGRVIASVRMEPGAGDVTTLRRAIGGADGGPIDVARLHSALLQSGSRDVPYDALWLNPEAVGDSVRLSVTAPPRDPWASAFGAAYDADLGLQGAIGVVYRRAFAYGGSVSLRGVADRWRQAVEVGARVGLRDRPRLVPLFTVLGAHEDVRRFTLPGVPVSSEETFDAVALLGGEYDLGAGWVARVAATFAMWQDSSAGSRDAPGLRVEALRPPPPRGIAGRTDLTWNAAYIRWALEASWSMTRGRLSLAPGLRLGWGRSLPLQHQFPLGGDEGFPGLQIGERRGDHEAVIRLRAAVRVVGPLHLTADVASGASAMGGRLLPDDDWLVGGRVGLGLFTPFGPVRLEYGRSSEARGAVFMRVGRWF